MELPDETLEKLKALLKECTALVIVDGKPRGSAVFVSPELVLTCEHVIRGGQALRLQPFGRPEVREVTVAEVFREGDVALLRVPDANVDAEQPCAAISSKLRDGRVSVVGFPREDGHPPGIEVRETKGTTRATGPTTYQLLQLEAGVIITFGMSGGPVLSHETGAVVALAQSSRHPVDALGGSAIPIARASELLDDIQRILERPPAAVHRWRNVLGREGWADLGLPWDLRDQIEVLVVEDESGWKIGVDPPPIIGLVQQQLPDLGGDINDALFRWAQRQRMREEEEVLVLGRLLAGALFPAAFASELRRLQAADKVMIRLTVPSRSRLADIPWELCAVPGTHDRFLAADKRYRFVRMLDDRMIPPAPTTDFLRVAGVVALPSRWTYPVVYGDDTYRYPPAAEIANHLTAAIEGERGGPVRPDVLVNPRPADIQERFVDVPERFEIFHLIAVGRTVRAEKDSVQVALVSEKATGASQKVGPKWEPLENVLSTAVAAGAKVVVLELMVPPVSSQDQSITVQTLAPTIPKQLMAVVVTRFPIHPRQAREFNETFYDQLRRRKSVETAVQLGRAALASNKPIEDSAGFGWFSLLTRGADELHLLRVPHGEQGRPMTEGSPTAALHGRIDEENAGYRLHGSGSESVQRSDGGAADGYSR
ncbi:trypsin-like serine peptidase [Lysobacter korlensis]|uniref:Trypsin-like serine peptidase n=1 Tax=Lysobacter korlensis TaxID=553636 RepID=A0ABV6RWQ9_9GAMM